LAAKGGQQNALVIVCLVMPGLVPGVHVLAATLGKSWMAGTSPAMTSVRMMVHYDISKGEPAGIAVNG
jgi:hypothetical protein